MTHEKALAKQEQGEPVAHINQNDVIHEAGYPWGANNTLEPLYRHPPQQRKPQDWSVFNTGAEVASGLTFEEAWDYLTPERLARGWSAVCVINKDNLPIEAAHGIKE